ncbi:hypothetical protein VNO78_11597 [Psophocarpus tetragonolobus]|uniref:Legume lectin domain-containing protein n=1 Tax=Psophocarpus tetragonolobus TaxID=3891 RepID=A0AAN9XNL0_PSOTE
MYVHFLVMLLSIFFLFIIPYACSLSFNFTSFGPNEKSIIYEGSANPVAPTIQLTRNQVDKGMNGSIGRATYYQPMHLWDKTTGYLADFTTHFTFVLSSQNRNKYGDGMAFFLGPAGSKLPNATKGGSLGLTLDNQRLNSTDNPFVAVEFDIYQNPYDPPGEHVGIDINSLRSVANVTWFADIKEGKLNEAGISYNSSSLNLTVVFTDFKNDTFLLQHLSAIIDLRLYLPEFVTFGFSAATGNATAIHSLSSWDFSSSSNIAPSQKKTNKTGLAMGLGIGGFVLIVPTYFGRPLHSSIAPFSTNASEQGQNQITEFSSSTNSSGFTTTSDGASPSTSLPYSRCRQPRILGSLDNKLTYAIIAIITQAEDSLNSYRTRKSRQLRNASLLHGRYYSTPSSLIVLRPLFY